MGKSIINPFLKSIINTCLVFVFILSIICFSNGIEISVFTASANELSVYDVSYCATSTNDSSAHNVLSYATSSYKASSSKVSTTPQKKTTVKTVKVKKIKVLNLKSKITLKKGTKLKLKIKVMPKKATNKKLSFKSSKKSVVSVSKKGVIKAKKIGRTTITIKTKDGSKKKVKIRIRVVKNTSTNNDADNKSTSNNSNKDTTIDSNKDSINTNLNNTEKDNKEKTPDLSSILITPDSEKMYTYTYPSGETVKRIKLSDSAVLTASYAPTEAVFNGVNYSSSDENICSINSDGVISAHNLGTVKITATSIDNPSITNNITVEVVSLDEEYSLIMHRGYSSKAPENSISAFKLAAASPCDGIECDLWETADHKVIICHNNSLKEFYGYDANITDSNWDDIKDLTMIKGANIDLYPNEHLPVLEDYLDIIKSSDKIGYLELKSGLSKSAIEYIVNAVLDYGLEDRVLYGSFYTNHLETVKSIYEEKELSFPSLMLFSFFSNMKVDAISNLTAVDYCIANNINLGVAYLSSPMEEIARIHENGLIVNIWAFNDYLTSYHMVHDLNVDVITNDYNYKDE